MSEIRKVINAQSSSNKYYLFSDKLIVRNKNDEILKVIYPPSDDKTFAKHMLVSFHDIYYENDYLIVVVSTRWNCWWFKFYDDTLELSKEYNFWKM